MSIDALKTILKTEQETEDLIQLTAKEIAKSLADADHLGQALLQQALSEAEIQAKEILLAATDQAEAIRLRTQKHAKERCESLRQTASEKSSQAVQLVVESIVVR